MQLLLMLGGKSLAYFFIFFFFFFYLQECHESAYPGQTQCDRGVERHDGVCQGLLVSIFVHLFRCWWVTFTSVVFAECCWLKKCFVKDPQPQSGCDPVTQDSRRIELFTITSPRSFSFFFFFFFHFLHIQYLIRSLSFFCAQKFNTAP